MAAISFRLCLLLSLGGAVLTKYLGGDQCQACLSSLLPIAVYLVLGGWEQLYIVLATLPRDAQGAIFRVKLLGQFREFDERIRSVPRQFERVVQRHPDKPCFIFNKQEYSFREISQLSTAVAIVLRDKFKLQPKDSVALLMPNKPEYVAIWLGVAKIGCATALVNTNVRKDSLLHSIKTANCSALVYDLELQAAVEEIRGQLGDVGVKHVLQWQKPKESGVVQDSSLQLEVEKVRSSDPAAIQKFEMHESDSADALLYIYTSGTTGLPKAAILRHRKYNHPPSGIDVIFLKPGDIIYDPLPLYHSSGGVIGVGLAILRGYTVVLRPKFSASQYFDDCIAHNCTVAQYIGEMCRYMLVQPERPTDKQHKVRLMLGNGLRQQVWVDFVKRFNIQYIGEFYGATEGNSQLINYSNKLGSCGFLSQVVPQDIDLFKVDRETGEPQRDEQGICIHCKPGEPGLLVGSTTSGHKSLSDFAGYTDKRATEKKMMKDVFRKGDAAFSTGDILVMDKFGFLYFVDRIGDTYRWKGENVSTTEVESVLSDLLGVEEDVVVFGVEVPGSEGRAGMAAITNKSGNNVATSSEFARQVENRLPAYARPVFIRVVKTVEATGTCKLRKVELKNLGFKPDAGDLQLLIYNAESRSYQPLSNELYQKLASGNVRL